MLGWGRGEREKGGTGGHKFVFFSEAVSSPASSLQMSLDAVRRGFPPHSGQPGRFDPRG